MVVMNGVHSMENLLKLIMIAMIGLIMTVYASNSVSKMLILEQMKKMKKKMNKQVKKQMKKQKTFK